MAKRFGAYSIIWVLALAIFNAIVFVVPAELNGIYRFTVSFWIAYAFITAAFVGQLLCGFFALKSRGNQALFYRIPLITLSYSGLVAMLVAGTIFMALPAELCWIGVIVCVLILGICAIAVIRSMVLANTIDTSDKKISASTAFMGQLEDRAAVLLESTREGELNSLSKRVYESIRYSDSVSSNGLDEANDRVMAQLIAFEAAVKENDIELARLEAESFLEVLGQRNRLCKKLK